MKVNETWSIEPNDYGWIVKKKNKFISQKGAREGERVETEAQLYPGTLEHACEIIIDEAAKKDTSGVKEILLAIRIAKEECVKAIEKLKYRHTQK